MLDDLDRIQTALSIAHTIFVGGVDHDAIDRVDFGTEKRFVDRVSRIV